MKRSFGEWASAICILISFGCATIVDGKKQPVSFYSDPKGAEVIINGRPMGVTPTTLILERSEYGDANIVFKKDGYEDQRATIRKSVNAWFWGNLLTGGLFGSSTDVASGAMWKFAPNHYYVSMSPLKASLDEWDRFARERAIRRFLLYSYSQLATDVVIGQGEYLTSLYEMLSVPAHQRPKALTRLESIMVSTNSSPTFTNAVIQEFKHRSVDRTVYRSSADDARP